MESFVAEESLNSVKVFWLDQEKLIKKVSDIAKEIGENETNILMIILFGSIADKRGIPGSDVDLLILLKNDPKPFIGRIPEWAEKFKLDFPVDLFPFTINEMDNAIVKNAIRNGLILFQR